MRTLSSPDTATAKLLFLPLWTAGWAVGTLALLAGLFSAPPEGYLPPPAGVVLLGLITMTALTVFAWWGLGPMKEVTMDERELRVSNFWRQITVPLAEVTEVTQDSWNDLVTVTLHRQTPFGRSIRFMPCKRFVTIYEAHPVVEEILAAARTARERGTVLAERPSRPDHPRPRRDSRDRQSRPPAPRLP